MNKMAARSLIGSAALELGFACFVNVPTSFCLNVGFILIIANMATGGKLKIVRDKSSVTRMCSDENCIQNTTES